MYFYVVLIYRLQCAGECVFCGFTPYHYLRHWRVGPPVPIPNTEVKQLIADNTCLETNRKGRSVQVPQSKKPRRNAGFFCGRNVPPPTRHEPPPQKHENEVSFLRWRDFFVSFFVLVVVSYRGRGLFHVNCFRALTKSRKIAHTRSCFFVGVTCPCRSGCLNRRTMCRGGRGVCRCWFGRHRLSRNQKRRKVRQCTT